MRKICSAFIIMLLACTGLHAQLTGIKTIPGDYATIAAAITDLNAQGVGAGGVTFNVAAGHTETLAAKLTITATGTAANPVVFQKSGAGANPVVTSYTGTVTTPSVIADGMIVLAGSDYITFDGINLQEAAANTTTAAVMEYGFGLFLASATDGCQNNTIRNCVITLNRVQNAAWTAPGHNGSVGIAVSGALHTATGAVTVTAASGSNSNNKFYSNTIQNCNAGIAFTGYAAPSPFTLGDTNNDVGGASAGTGNTILNYGGAAGATQPATGIFASNQWGFNCSYNTVNNNNGSGVNHVSTLRGIFLNSSSVSASATCNNNTVTVSSGATTSQLTGIDVQFGSTAAGNTINVNNNTVQNCTYSTATSGTFQGILTSTTAATVNVNGNTVNNNTQAGTGQFDCIVIQSTPTNAFASNNTVTNNAKTGTGTMHGIYHSGSATNVTYNANTVTGNQIQGASGTLYGLRLSTSLYTVSNNNINNNSIPGTSGATACSVYGIYDLSAPTGENIFGNTIHSLNIGGAGTATANLVYGIQTNTSASSVKNIYNNIIYNLSYDNTSTGSATIIGIQQSLATTANIYSNKIYDLNANSGAASLARGIQISSGTTLNVYNNYIGSLSASNSASADAVRGLNIISTSVTSNQNISYNTIYINTGSSASPFGSAGIFHTYSATATTSSLVMRNNIVVNTSTAAGTGLTVALRRSASTDLNNYNTLSNNNLFYAGTPSAANLIYYDGTNSDQTLAAFKTRVAPRESASISEAPNFLSITGGDPDFLHIDPAIATQIESGAAPVAGITTDYDGDTRNASTPDIGADEFNGIGADLTAPSISYSPLSFTCATADRTLSNVTITDATGVPTTGTLRPRIYYRKNAGAWFSQPGTLNSGTATNGNWSFTIVAADMGGLATADVVSYYIIAQDVVGTPNIGSNPAGAVATDVNTVTTPPGTPNTYTIAATLSGVYTVGAGGNYATLTAAIAAYQTSCLGGAVVFELTNASYSGSETFPIVINQHPDASAVNTLTIRPAAGNAALITAAVNAGAVIKLNGADYIIIDGSNSGGTDRSLTIQNTTATTSGNAVLWLSSPAAGNGANNNVVKNTIIEGNTATTSFIGLFVGGNATISLTAAGTERNNGNTVNNNLFRKTQHGLVMFGFAAASPDQNNSISSNNFGTATAGEGFALSGMTLDRQENLVVSGNEVQNITNATTASNVFGIRLLDFKNGQAYNNRIHSMAYTGTSTPKFYGIAVSSSTYTTAGNPSNALIYNNAVSNITSTGTSAVWNTTGMLAGAGYGDRYYYNSVHLPGQLASNAAGLAAAFAAGDGNITAIPTNVDVRNNIFSITGSSSVAGGNFWAYYTPATTLAGSILNYNDLYCNGTNVTNNIGRFNAVNHTTLAAWQAATGQEANSINVAPVFTSVTDLHLVPASNTALNGSATPIAGITTDFEGDVRNVTIPDMGADEFAPPAGIDLAAQSLQAPVVKNCYTSAETVTVRIQNGSANTHDFSVNPATVTVNVTGAVTATLSATVNSGTLASGATLDVNMSSTLNMSAAGTYTFNGGVAVTGDINSGNDNLTAVNRTVVTLTAGTVSSSPGSYCVTPGIPVLTLAGQAGVGNIQWQESTISGTGPWTNVGTNAATYTPGAAITGTTYYRAEVSCNGNTAYTNVDTVELNNPQLLTTTPGSRCGTGTVTLAATASAGSTVFWYAAATGGAALASGSSFTTPAINTTTTYYASASSGGSAESVASPTAGTSTFITTSTGWGLRFTANQATTISTVKIKCSNTTAGAASIQIRVTDLADVVLYNGTLHNFSITTSLAEYTVPVDIAVPPGNYKMVMTYTGISAMVRESSGVTFPYNAPSGAISITAGANGTGTAQTTTAYYWFYNWTLNAGCETARTAVTATVTAPPAIATVADATICNNEGKMLNVTSTLGDFDTYTWTPQTGLFTDNTYTTPYTGQNLSTVFVKTATGGTTNYVVTGTQTGGSQCANTDTVAITVMPATVINGSPAEICVSGGSTLTLSPATGYGAGSIQWQTSATGGAGTYTDISGQTGTSYITPVITATTWYGVTLKDGAGVTCQLNPTFQLTVNNPAITGTTPGSRCGPGTVNLAATGTAGSTLSWFAAASGGAALGTGASFTTPSINTSTTYYVSAGIGATNATVGPNSPTTLGSPSSSNIVIGTQYMLFDVTAASATISAVDIYPTAAIGSNFSIVIRNSAGTDIFTTGTLTTTVTGGATPQTVTLNAVIPAGTGYRLGMGVNPGLQRNTTGASYPYAVPGVLSFTGNSFDPVYWYFFYNVKVQTGCASPRTAVTATVNHAPLSVITPPVSFITCDSVKLSVPGASDIKITEITLQRNGTGQTATYPAFAPGEDLIEISNISASPVDVSGYTFADFANNSGTAVHPYTIPAATIIPAGGVLILHLGTGTDDAGNRYFNTGGTDNNWTAASQAGFVLKNTAGAVVDAVGCGGSISGSYTFATGTGVTAADWSGFAPNAAGFAGVTRLVTTDNNAGSDWLQSNTPTPVQTMGSFNAGLAYPVYLWAPATGLFTDAALTVPYAGQNLATVYAKPGSTTIYSIQGNANGCTASSNAQVNVLAPGVLEWTGAVNTDWTNAGNWKCGITPTVTSNVHISSGKPNYPVINLNVEVRSLTLTSGASVTVGTGFELKLNGN